MKRIVLLLASSMFAYAAYAQETAEDAAFLDFIKVDPKVPAPKNVPEPPIETVAMLEKWKTYEAAQMAKVEQNILAGRKIAVEMLTKKALQAANALQEPLLREAEQIQTLPAEALLSYSIGKNEARYQALLGLWWDKLDHSWAPEFQARGVTVLRGKKEAWHWIDEEAGVVAIYKGWNNLLVMEKPGIMQGINEDRHRFTLERTLDPKTPATDPVIFTLNAAEIAQRSAAADALGVQRQRVVTWLRAKARKMSAGEAADLLQNIRLMEEASDKKSSSSGRLAGVWRWDRVEILFKPFGIVVTKDGRKAGRWGWLGEDHRELAVVLSAGKITNNVFIAKSPTSPQQVVLEVHRLSEGKFTATRTLP